MKRLMALILLGGLVLASGTANATLWNYAVVDSGWFWNDNGNHTPGGQTPGNPWATLYQNNLGVPDFLPYNLSVGIERTPTANTWSSLTLQYRSAGSGGTLLLPGDIFIDTDQDLAWDYVVKSPFTGGGIQNTADVTGPTSSTFIKWDVYKFAGGLSYDSAADAALYKLSGGNSGVALTRDGKTWGSKGYTVRENHPWAVKSTSDGSYQGSVSWDGWKDNVDPGTTTWQLSELATDIPVTGPVYLGFTVNCANDVIWEPIRLPSDLIPEPASLLIWSVVGGLGAAGVALKRRRQAKAGRWSDENRQAIFEVVEGRRR